MNKTFKVVFNKSRGVMTVVNEATSSVQAKGCKAVVAAACVLAASCATAGGVVASSNDSTPKIEAIFNGGALNATSDVPVSNSLFEKYSATGHGGAIYIGTSGKITIDDGVSEESHTTFENNSAGNQGGAIYNGGTITIGNYTGFDGNTALVGGAISNNTTHSANTIGDHVTFKNNTATWAGAIFNQNAELTLGDSVEFTNNRSDGKADGSGVTSKNYGDGGMGGAIMNQANTGDEGTTKITIGQNALFDGNVSEQSSGGAVANFRHTKEGQTVGVEEVVFEIGANASFIGNEAGQNGGAIYNNATFTIIAGDDNTLTKFEENQAETFGGAIYNHTGTMTIADNAEFKMNSAVVAGGAIFNNGSGTVQFGKASFTDNSAASGGAIFNQRATLKIKDFVQFVGNSANGGESTSGYFGVGGSDNGSGGAIMNQADQSNSVHLTIDSGAEFKQNTATNNGGAVSNYAWTDTKGNQSDYSNSNVENVSITFNGDASFTENTAGNLGGAIYNDGTIDFNGNATFSGNTAGGVLNDIHNEGIVNVNKGTLTLDGGITGDGKLIFADETGLSVKVGTSQEDSTTITNDVTLNGTVNLSMTFAPGYDGTYQVAENVSVTEGAEGFKVTDNAVFNITAVEGANGTFNIEKKSTAEIAESAGVSMNQAAALNAITSEGTSTNATYSAVAEQINTMIQSGNTTQMQAAADAVTAMSPEAAPMASQVQTDTAAQVFNVIGSRLGGSQGMASGDGTSGTGLWVQGMVGTTDMDDTAKAHGYSADTTGFALGLEAKPSDSTKVGMGFAYTNTDVDGFLRTTDVDSYTAFLYGEYKPSNWFVNGIVSYAWANYDEQKSVLGQNIGAKYDADTLGLQVMGGLDLDASGFTVTPEVGLRYYHIGTDAYTDGMGTAVSDSDEDVLTGVIGARLGKTFEVSPSMTFVPEVRLAMTYDIVDADNTSFVTLANGSSYAVDGETLDRFGIEAGVGVKAEMGDNFEMSLSYEGAWRGDYQNHAGILNAKYKF